MNARTGSTKVEGVVGKFGVDGVNENGQYLVDICADTFQHKMIHRYTWARGNERILIDYIAVDYSLRREVEDARVVRGIFSGSDHFAAIAKVRMRERRKLKGNGQKEVKEEN